MALTDEEYKKKAEAAYDPQYNQKITLLNNALNQQTDTLNSQKGSIDEQYNTQEAERNRNNAITKNNYSDIQTDRGLGRSTVATTGLAGLDDKNARILGEINKARGREIGNVDTQINTLKNNKTNTIAQMGMDRENSLSALINQFRQEDTAKEERDRAYQLQLQQFEFQKQEAEKNRQLQQQQLAASIAKAKNGSSGSGSKASMQSQYYSKFQKAISNGDYETAKSMVYDDQFGIKQDLGASFWSQLENELWDWQSGDKGSNKQDTKYKLAF